ncbi:MAG: P1 family peptidase [Oscillospiraceae bacterium]|nr:P1 family peptidase [Oscillospiraceae bacterium]
MLQLRARDYNLTVGELPTGKRNKITDVLGLTVGHCTVDTEDHKTGVTVLLPCPDNPFVHKLPAACFVLNGFGKSLGMIQVEELGTLETPIALTNTLNVGLVHDAMVEYMVTRGETEGVPVRSVNPIVCECNDGGLNHIQLRAVGREQVFTALAAASPDFEEGDVGAGKGMVCHGLKGGIGSASRLIELDEKTYTLGALVLANHGSMKDLTVCGNHIGPQLDQAKAAKESDVGSCIIILATDLPLDSRQLGRVAKRASVGLARLGSYIGHGSGEVFLAFSTANPFDPREEPAVRQILSFHEEKMDLPFRAAAECVEEAVLNCLFTARTCTGWDKKTVYALLDLWNPEA